MSHDTQNIETLVWFFWSSLASPLKRLVFTVPSGWRDWPEKNIKESFCLSKKEWEGLCQGGRPLNTLWLFELLILDCFFFGATWWKTTCHEALLVKHCQHLTFEADNFLDSVLKWKVRRPGQITLNHQQSKTHEWIQLSRIVYQTSWVFDRRKALYNSKGSPSGDEREGEV